VVRVVPARESFLVVSDNFLDGWRATSNGRPLKIYRANYAFRAVHLGPGAHQVEFRYRPVSFTIGVIVSAVACLALCGYLVYTRTR